MTFPAAFSLLGDLRGEKVISGTPRWGFGRSWFPAPPAGHLEAEAVESLKRVCRL